jgi:hypothetical protein
MHTIRLQGRKVADREARGRVVDWGKTLDREGICLSVQAGAISLGNRLYHASHTSMGFEGQENPLTLDAF